MIAAIVERTVGSAGIVSLAVGADGNHVRVLTGHDGIGGASGGGDRSEAHVWALVVVDCIVVVDCVGCGYGGRIPGGNNSRVVSIDAARFVEMTVEQTAQRFAIAPSNAFRHIAARRALVRQTLAAAAIVIIIISIVVGSIGICAAEEQGDDFVGVLLVRVLQRGYLA